MTLATHAATAATMMAKAASGRSRHTVRRSTTEIRGILLFPHEPRVGRPETPLQLRAHLLGDAHCVNAVANDLRADEDDELGARLALRGVAQQVAKWKLVDD